KGAWALQFRVVQNFQLASFQGSTISIKRHLSDGTALRAGVSIGFSLLDEEGTDYVNDSITYSDDLDDDQISFGFVVQMIKYPSPSASTNLYYGIGPTFTYSYSKDYRLIRSRGDVSPKSTDRKRTTWRAGASGVVGIEWFPRSNISFHAEYDLSLYYTQAKYTEDRPGSPPGYKRKSETNTDGFVLDGSNIKLGLSVYF
ncbi:MAG: hypothetical protein WBB67_09135, partial [bacterium]